MLQPDEIALGANARQAVVAKCMRAHGFEYRTAPYAGTYNGAGSLGELLRSDKRSADEADAYGLQPLPEAGSDPVAIKRYEDALKANNAQAETNKAFAEALDPDVGPANGCAAQGSKSLYGEGEANFNKVQTDIVNRLLEAIRKIYSVPDYALVEAAWSSCMAKGGYQYQTLDLLERVRWPNPRPGQLERSTAVADVECEESSGLRRYVTVAARAAVDSWVESNAGIVEQARTSRMVYLERCKAILG